MGNLILQVRSLQAQTLNMGDKINDLDSEIDIMKSKFKGKHEKDKNLQ